jgi:hypothetical protein
VTELFAQGGEETLPLNLRKKLKSIFDKGEEKKLVN